MGGGVSKVRGGVLSLLDAGADRLAEIGLVVMLGMARAWKAYEERRDKKRPGRRSADVEAAACMKSIKRIESITGELKTALERLGERVHALESKRTRRSDP